MPSLIPPVLHPLLVHTPIILLPLAALLVSLESRLEWARKAAHFVLGLAAVGTVLTLMSGLAAGDGFENTLQGAAATSFGSHEFLAWVTTTFAVGSFVLWFWQRDALYEGRWARVWPVLLWFGVAVMVVTAWYGGALVYEYGVGVP